MINFIDTFVLACHQTVVNKSQKRQAWLFFVAIKFGLTVQLLSALFDFSWFLVILWLIVAPIALVFGKQIHDICPLQGLTTGPFVIASNFFLWISIIDSILLIFFPSSIQVAITIFNFAFMSGYYFLRCGEPKPPERKHKFATEMN